MYSAPTDSTQFDYSTKPPILIGASSDSAMLRATRVAAATGCRIGDWVTISSARERIERQIAASAIWLEIDHDDGPEMDELLASIGAGAGEGRFAAVVSTTSELIDPVSARIGDSSVQLIVDPSDAERAAALAVAFADLRTPLALSDIASDQNAARLKQLSDEVGRIASTLARLSSGPAATGPILHPVPSGDAPPVSAETVRAVIRARRMRSRYFSAELFADPAWDMLLDLLQAEIAHLRVPVSSLCIAAAVPATTALRWLKTMVSEGIFVRRADPHDGRRVFVELAPEASEALRRYFSEVGQAAVI